MPKGIFVRSKEHNKHLSESLKGRQFSKEHNQHLSLALKGRKLSEEHIQKLKGKPRSEETKKKISLSLKNNPTVQSQLISLHEAHKEKFGSLSSNYVDGNTINHSKWRDDVWIDCIGRCVKCGVLRSSNGTELDCHHILSREEYPELKYDVENGVTLCRADHTRYHGIYGSNGSVETLDQFLFG
jgi:hypothetical protein